MTVRVSDEGATSFNVEEYKRPKFKVDIGAPKVAARLDAEVRVTGTATFYTGAAVDGAGVKWRVVREVQFPIWWRTLCWWWPPVPGGSQEIAHGTATTTEDGTFDVTFVARPDVTAPKESEPIFHYTVYADVTDTAGETRSDELSVNVGYTAVRAQITAEDWQTVDKAVELTLKTETLDGIAQAAEGTIKIHKLIEPEAVHRGRLNGDFVQLDRIGFRPEPGTQPPPPDLSNPNSWKLGDVAFETNWKTAGDGSAKISAKLAAGAYRAVLTTQDAFKNNVTAHLPLQVLDPGATKFTTKIPHSFTVQSSSVEPGSEFNAVWGSGYEHARSFVEIEHRGKVLESYWTKPDATQARIARSVSEDFRGGFVVRVTQISENRAYLTRNDISVPWTNKDLTLKWEHFTSKLEPAQKETWTLTISGSGAEKAAAEMVGALYDESLDAYLPHDWSHRFDGAFYQNVSWLNSEFANSSLQWRGIHGSFDRQYRGRTISYRSIPADIVGFGRGYARFGVAKGMMVLEESAPRRRGLAGFVSAPVPMSAPAPMADAADKAGEARSVSGFSGGADMAVGAAAVANTPKVNLDQVSARTNLNETAFFYPHLISDANGSVKIEFQIPEALTRWKFLGFAHDAKMRAGYITDSTVTAKDLMVQPNPPRFVREGDALEFTVKVLNQSDAPQQGKVRLAFADARTGDAVSEKLGLAEIEQAFDIPSKQSRAFSWKIRIPDGMGFLTYKAVGATEKLSDGEEGYLPVLPRRILVTESLPLPIRGAVEKMFKFDKLGASAGSDTLRHEKLVVQMVSNPSWYAVMALPYLMEFPHECSEQLFNRLYANSLASHIAASDPKIRKVFDQWRGTKTLESPLEKNQDIKGVMLEETPWVRQSNDETAARQNVGILFETNRLKSEQDRAKSKLADRQLGSGLWSWFPGGRGDRYITLYIVTGFGRLRHLGVNEVDVAPAIKALGALDGWIDEQYREILKYPKTKDENHLNPTIALYLYGRSFFLEDRKVGEREALKYWLGQARKYWLSQNRQSQAHLAIGLQRFGEKDTPGDIMISIKEHAVSNEEMGMFWRDTEESWWWYRAPIETQAMMIEAFAEVAKDDKAVEDCKVWLLKQKQTQDWKTTKATADAIYALLLRGTGMLASDELVEVSLGGSKIEPKNVEAGTGFYEQRFAGAEVTAGMSEIKVKKVDEGVAWGSVHWQYLEDMSKVTPHEGTPLTLKKSLWVKENTPKGPALKPAGELKVGDELVVRIELRSDRDMEYLHMKDQRGAGTEPVNVLSEYKDQDGLRYYESTRDTASHFFIDYLPKGTYVFEYSSRVVHRGEYQSGMANIECMYAPEFNSHSESFKLTAK
jgi:hypothetical protein